MDMDKDTERTGPKYPDCVVQLSGMNGNAVLLFGKVRRELVRHLQDNGMNHAEATALGAQFREEATSGDYDNVLATCHRWVTVI